MSELLDTAIIFLQLLSMWLSVSILRDLGIIVQMIDKWEVKE